MTEVELQHEFNRITRTKTLHELVDEILTIIADAEVTDGEIGATADQRLDALNLSLEQKAEAYAAVYARLGAESDALKALAKRYADKAKARESEADRLRARLLDEMQRIGRGEIKAPTATARVQKSPDKLELSEDDDAVLLSSQPVPDEFVVTTRRIDRKKLAAALKAGRSFAWAWLKSGTHLRFY